MIIGLIPTKFPMKAEDVLIRPALFNGSNESVIANVCYFKRFSSKNFIVSERLIP